jgi:hypothetical protein
MKKLKTFKAWGIPYGKGTQQITIEIKAYCKKQAKLLMQKDGTILKSEIYQ